MLRGNEVLFYVFRTLILVNPVNFMREQGAPRERECCLLLCMCIAGRKEQKAACVKTGVLCLNKTKISLGWVRTTNLSINSRTRCQLRHERCYSIIFEDSYLQQQSYGRSPARLGSYPSFKCYLNRFIYSSG